MMVHQFEDAVYAAKVGELYGPFRTRFGYHLVKVWDKRPRTPDIRAAHILVQCSSSADDTLKAYQKIRALYDSLQQGRDFAELARLYSEDPSTASRDGDIGFFGLGRTVKPFEEAAFALKNVGDISPIIRSPFGYHIIKLLDRKPLKSLEEEREELKFMLRRNPEKINAETGRLTARLKKLHSYRENPAAIAALHAALDTTAEGYTKLESLSSDTVRNMLCFAFAQRQYTIDSLLSYMRAFVGKRKLTEKDLIAYRDSYAQRELIDYEITLLETRYPEFAKLMRDYTDGILLFTVSERTVWDKSNANDSIARAYFDAHRNEFQFGERVQISQIVVSSKSLIEALREELVEKRRTLDLVSADSVKQARRALRAALAQLKRGTKDYASKKDSLLRRLASLKVDDQPRTFEVLAQRYSEKYDSATGAKVGLFQKGENMLADIVFQSELGSISAPITFEERYYLIRLDRREPARPKTFEEALPEIYSRYQDERNRELEAAWVKRLREKSQIQVFEATLKAAFLSTPATQTAMTR
jgi:peptidyl-prolyl cis-trans isomerase SurA